jgi:hypothetical protein
MDAGLSSNDRFWIRREQIIEDVIADGPWLCTYDVDEYIPRGELNWLQDPWRWDHWWAKRTMGPGDGIDGYRYWFEVMHDASGLGCRFWYPEDPKEGDAIEMLVTGMIRNRERRIPWIHGRSGLVHWELTPVLQEMLLLHYVF